MSFKSKHTTNTMVVAVLLIFLISLLNQCRSFTVTIKASREKCFGLLASGGQKLFGSYEVVSGGNLDINIKITDSENGAVYEEPAKQEGSFEFVASKNGQYRLCLNNMATVSAAAKEVSFAYHVAKELEGAGLHASSFVICVDSNLSECVQI